MGNQGQLPQIMFFTHKLASWTNTIKGVDLMKTSNTDRSSGLDEEQAPFQETAIYRYLT